MHHFWLREGDSDFTHVSGVEAAVNQAWRWLTGTRGMRDSVEYVFQSEASLRDSVGVVTEPLLAWQQYIGTRGHSGLSMI